MGLVCPVAKQYQVYLFERILLCCKEMNPNKSKNRIVGGNRPIVDARGKPRLQLKGRIFMQNVTDVLSFVKTGKYITLLRVEPSFKGLIADLSQNILLIRSKSSGRVTRE